VHDKETLSVASELRAISAAEAGRDHKAIITGNSACDITSRAHIRNKTLLPPAAA